MSAIGTLSVFFMVLANLAVTVIGPLHHLIGIPTVPIGDLTIPLAQMSIWGYLAYVVSNWMAAKWGSPETHGIDLLFSVLAAISINVTFVQVFRMHPFWSLNEFMYMPLDRQVLAAATLYSWYDVLWRQRANWAAFLNALTRLMAVVLALLVVGILVALAFGVDIQKMREQLFLGKATSCRTLSSPAVSEPIGYDRGGMTKYRFTFEVTCDRSVN